MKTKCVRLHGKMDLRLEEIELPEVGPDDVQVKIVSDSICMSSYKAAVEGEEHKRVPDDVAKNPTIIGHEFCGDIIAVGENWKHKYKVGDHFSIQHNQEIDLVFLCPIRMADSLFKETQRYIGNRQRLRYQIFRHHALVHGQAAFHKGFVQVAFQIIRSGSHRQQQSGIAHIAFQFGWLHGEFAEQIRLIGARTERSHHGIVNPADGVLVARKTVTFAQGRILDLFIMMGQL